MGKSILAVSLWQPWASLLVHGEKRVETRSWSLTRGGRRLPCVLAVHAAAKWTQELSDLAWREPFCTALAACGVRQLSVGGRRCVTKPLGMRFGTVVGVVRVAECRSTDDLWAWGGELPYQERAFGNYSPGRFAWVCDQFHAFAEPVPCRGCQSLFQWEPPTGLELPEWVAEGCADA